MGFPARPPGAFQEFQPNLSIFQSVVRADCALTDLFCAGRADCISPYVVVPTVPLIAEKPFISADKCGKYLIIKKDLSSQTSPHTNPHINKSREA